MKKFNLFLLIMFLITLLFTAGCSSKESSNSVTEQNTNNIESTDEETTKDNIESELVDKTENDNNENSKKTNETTTNLNTDIIVASEMANFFYDLQAINKYYDDGLTAMAKVNLDTSKLSYNNNALLTYIKSLFDNQFIRAYALQSTSNVPQEFYKPLSPQGTIPAPPGACPAAAEPKVSYITAGGNTVTPQLIEKKNLQTIPTELVTIDQTDKDSLVSKIENMVEVGDQRLATSEGWNTLLWDQLKELRTPVTSMMDYQLWNASPDIEQEIANLYLQKLQTMGAPSIVINAFNNSNKTGWFTNSQPTAQDALAGMDIEAKMTGSINGTVYEQRDFSIPGAGKIPIFGSQTGEGTVTWDHPEYGLMTFDVDILLDKFDAKGRAIGGNVVGTDETNGYKIIFEFKSNGSKEGQLIKNGENVGQLNMSTNAEKFENYVNVKTNQTQSLYNLK